MVSEQFDAWRTVNKFDVKSLFVEVKNKSKEMKNRSNQKKVSNFLKALLNPPSPDTPLPTPSQIPNPFSISVQIYSKPSHASYSQNHERCLPQAGRSDGKLFNFLSRIDRYLKSRVVVKPIPAL